MKRAFFSKHTICAWMKKIILSFVFTLSTVGLMAQDPTTITFDLTGSWGDYALFIGGILLVAFWDKYLDGNSKIKSNNVVSLIANSIIALWKKKFLNKAVIVAGIFFLANGFYANQVNAQVKQGVERSKFGSLFTDIDRVVENNLSGQIAYKTLSDSTVSVQTTTFDGSTTWLPRIAVAVSAFAVNLKDMTNQSLSAVGFGGSYGQYTKDSSGEAYCTYSVNALLLTTIEIGDETSSNLGGAITVDCFNKIIGCGIGYVDGKALGLINVSIPL